MALARSASGPGGLSINTSSANSLFGSSSTTPAAGAMFGSTQASKPLFGAATTTTAPQSGGLFGSAAATTSQPAGGLFAPAATTSQPSTGGLFGTAAVTSQPQTGGLFGSAQQGGGGLFGNTNTSQPTSSGGLFGSSTTTSQPQQSGGLFGGLGSQPSQNQNQNISGGLFGASSTQQNQSGGLFGGGLNALNQNKPATTSLFGLGSSQTQQSQPQQSTMFASTQSQQPSNGGFMSNQQQQTVPGVRIDMANIKSSTRLNDLHDELQKQLESIDSIILGQMEHMKECAAMMPQHEVQLSNIPPDVEFCSRKLKGIEDLMEGDAEAVSALRDLIEEDAEHAKLSFRAIDNLKLPPQYHNPGHWPAKAAGGDNRSQGNSARDAQDIVGYFSSTADELTEKLAKYQKNVAEIELHLRGVETSTAQQIHTYISRRNGGVAAQNDEIQELVDSLQEFERGILSVAGKVGSTREGVQKLQLGSFLGVTNGGPTNTKRSNIY